MKMKAAYLATLGAPLVIDSEVEFTDPREGQVLVKLAYSGVCHSQLMEARGKRGEDPYLPHMLGHEGTGVVVQVGPGVRKVREGDRVVLGWIKGEGLDAPGTQYRKGDLTINAGGVTTFMEYAIVSENRCTHVPAGVPLDAAVLFGCAMPTGAGIVLNTLQPKPGSSLAVWGLGGIGLSALIASQFFQCQSVIGIDLEQEKLELAKELGATHYIHSACENVLARIKDLTHGQGVDYCVEAAGYAETIEKAFQAVRKGGGLCVFASHPRHGDRISLDPFELICGKRILGSWGGDSLPDRDIPKFGELYRQGKLPVGKLLSRRYPLTEVNTALNDLEQRRINRALIEIDPSLGRT